MRDPDRIERVIEKLRRLWYSHPDQRLGQLLCNVAPRTRDLFQVEDDVTEDRLDVAIQGGFDALTRLA